MMKLNTMYRPLTSRPFLSNQTYREYQPCELLRPYVSCYWVSSEDSLEQEGKGKEVLVIPDTCMDIIIRVNHTSQRITGLLCGIQDRPFLSADKDDGDRITCFAIRFHFWAAHLFMKLDFKDAQNQLVDLEYIGRDWMQLFEPFLYITAMEERIAWVEAFLKRKLDGAKWNPHLFNSVHQILTVSGRESVKDICAYSCVSQRQMERLFLHKVGLPLKRMGNLVRYQSVWKDMVLSRHFDVQDAVYRYGYTDQSHLLNEFKRFHGTSPKEAKSIAFANR